MNKHQDALDEIQTSEPDTTRVPNAFIDEFKARGQNYKKSTPTPKEVLLIDFFSGAGGMTEGFVGTGQSSLKFRHLGAIDIDNSALETLKANNPVPTFQFDIAQLAAEPEKLAELIPEVTRTADRPPLVFVGCPPCQGFSAHRKKDSRDDPRNSLIGAFTSAALEYLPDVVVIENVPEMFKGRFGHYYDDAAQRLRRVGYHVSESVLDLSRYGVPQKRKRAVVTASLSGDVGMPVPTHLSNNVVTVRDAIGHLPEIESGQTDDWDPWHRAPKHTQTILTRIRNIPEDGGDRRDLPEDDQLACHRTMGERHSTGFTDVYGRLRWDQPSVTITAKSSTPSCGRFLHPEQHRNISVREAALLQTFPHNYVFRGGFVNQYRQVGEAVPPLFARHLAYQVLDHINPHAEPATTATKAIGLPEEELSKRSEPSFHAVELFCGAGGLSLGLKAAGANILFAGDIDADAVDTYNDNIGPHAKVVDVLDNTIVKQIDEATAGKKFSLFGGPPCQGFSQQRRGKSIDVRNQLVLRQAEIALSLKNRPMVVVLENVMYLDSPRGKKILSEYVTKLEEGGYTIRRFDINSADYGVPQTRKRIIIVAQLDDTAMFPIELAPTTAHRWVTIGEALANTPFEQSSELPNHVVSKESALNKRRMAFVDMGRGRTAIPESLQMKCHKGYEGHLDVFGRLDWFEFARTITGGFDSSSRGEYTHPYRHRSITAREAASIQGFPEWFTFRGNKAAIRRQIGNAVPPTLGHAIANAIDDAIKAYFERVA